MKRITLLLWLLAGVTGCTTVNTVERAQPAAQRNIVSDKRVITDGSLNRKVQIVALNENVGAGGFLKVQAEVINTTRSYQRFSYKFEWFDENGMLVSTPTSTFIPRQIEGQESLSIAATAPTPTVRDFRLKLIESTQ